MHSRQQRDLIGPLINAGLTIIILLLLGLILAQAQAGTNATPTAWPTITPSLTPAPTATPTPGPTPTLTATPAQACPLPDLLYGQHLSASGSYTETQTQAAGPMVCRIERGSCAYRLLVGNLDPRIVFKREEEPPYDEEDIKMHPAILLPLYRLRELVEAEWGSAVQVRVTDAYDSILEHDLNQPDLEHRYSLHFEGRAVDLTTWPVEPAYYGRLCALAHCAGFDWVHHEGDHCHASVKADSLCWQCRE